MIAQDRGPEQTPPGSKSCRKRAGANHHDSMPACIAEAIRKGAPAGFFIRLGSRYLELENFAEALF